MGTGALDGETGYEGKGGELERSLRFWKTGIWEDWKGVLEFGKSGRPSRRRVDLQQGQGVCMPSVPL